MTDTLSILKFLHILLKDLLHCENALGIRTAFLIAVDCVVSFPNLCGNLETQRYDTWK